VTRFVCFGEVLIRLAAPGHELLLQSPRLETSFAGAEANVAVALACLGHEARLASVLPNSPLGHAAVRELRRHGVDTRGIAFGAGRMGLYFLAPGAGRRAADITYDRAHSAFAEAAPSAIDWHTLLEGADWLHVSGVTPAVSARAVDATLHAMMLARAAGARISFDANFRAKLWEARGADPRPVLDAIFAEADLAFAAARDLTLVTGVSYDTDADSARAAFARYPKLQRIAGTQRQVLTAEHHTLSAAMFTRESAVHSEAWEVSGIVDRIGAGDAFAAGLLHGLATGAPDQGALDFALAAACIKHTIPGDFCLASEHDIQLFMAGGTSDVRR
jgi:2-dehydro-3-deoxygluconokinase